MNLIRRVVASYRLAVLDIGRGMFTEDQLKIHRFSDSVRITDLTNAGKRGKVCKELTIIAGYLQGDLADKVLKQAVSTIMHSDYAQAKAKLEALAEEHPGLFTLSERTLKGVDVEPVGSPVNLEKKFPDGTIVTIEATPHEFMVKNSTVIGGDKASAGHRQDTLYWQRSKKDGAVFYAWAKANLSKLASMTILDLMKVWGDLGVKFDQH